jgi:hypothetical protein
MSHAEKNFINKEELNEYYSNSLTTFLEEVYYYPHIIVTAESGAGKSTFISRLSTSSMRDFLKMEIGHIRSTACTAQHVFDPNLPEKFFAVSAKKKNFGEIRDIVIAIAITELANQLVDYSKDKDEQSKIKIIESLYESIFIKNKSLFNLSEIVNSVSVVTIKEKLILIFNELIKDDYVEKARIEKDKVKEKAKNRVIKKFVEDEISKNIRVDQSDIVNTSFEQIFDIMETAVNAKVDTTFTGKQGEYLYSIFDILDNTKEGIEFMGKLFGTSNGSKDKTNKGIQFFLDEITVHVPTNEIYKKDKPFVVLDTQGLNHEGDDKNEIQASFLTLINYNRVNQIIFLSPFSTDDKVFGIVREGLDKIKKKIGVTLLLSKYDEYINSAIVSTGKDTDDLDDKELKEFVEEQIVPLVDKSITDIKESISIYNENSSLVTFDQHVHKLCFNRNIACSLTTVTDLYEIINSILIKIEKDTTSVFVKQKPGTIGDVDSLVNFKIDKQRLVDMCKIIINENAFIRSLKGWWTKSPHWNSVYELKYKIKMGSGHSTNAWTYDNFSIYPASGVRTYLEKYNLLDVLFWDFGNLLNVPENLQEVLKSNIEMELKNNVYQRIAKNMTYTYITDYFYASSYYLNWYRGLLAIYNDKLSDPYYWADAISNELELLVKVKVRETISLQYND